MKMLFCTDLNEPDAVIEAVERLAARMDADVLVLHVVAAAEDAALNAIDSTLDDPMTGLGGHSPYSLYDAELQAERDEAEAAAFHRFLTRRFKGSVRAALKRGDPAAVILADAEAQGVDLIAMGKHHRSAFERLLMGSTPKQVLKASTRPVLLLPIAKGDDGT